MNPDQFDTVVANMAQGGATRRRAVAAVAGFAAALFGANSAIEAKKKRKKRNKRNKRKSKRNPGAALDKPPHVALGVYMPGAPNNAGVMNGLRSVLGRDPDYVSWYETWSHGNFDEGNRRTLRNLSERDMMPVIFWEPYDPDGPLVNQPTYSLPRIYGGAFDSYIDSWAEGLAAYDDPVFLIFAHEMNGDWFTWGIGVNGNSNDGRDFVKAWRYIHDRFERAGATNVRWVWMPNMVYDSIPASLEQVFPGDSYVDWFGMNGYNWGTSVYWESCPCQSKWESFDKVFGETYRQLTAFGNKPIMIGETASSDDSGKPGKKGKKKRKKSNGKKKAQWIRQAMLSSIPNKYPNIRAFTWFNTKATGRDTKKNGKVIRTVTVDWRFTSSRKSRKAFAAAARTPYYTKSLRDI